MKRRTFLAAAVALPANPDVDELIMYNRGFARHADMRRADYIAALRRVYGGTVISDGILDAEGRRSLAP